MLYSLLVCGKHKKRGEFVLLLSFKPCDYQNIDSRLARALMRAVITLIHSTQNGLGLPIAI